MSSYSNAATRADVHCKTEPGPSNCEEEVVYDPMQVEELEQYEMVEEVHSFDVDNMSFQSNVRNSPPHSAKRSARSTQIPSHVNVRRQPHRESRVKSFKQLLDYSDKAESEVNQKAFLDMAPARVFITNDVVGMHLDWPLYSQQAESFSTAAHIIVSEAALVRSSLICLTVPQEFTEVGTFVVAISGLQDRHEVTQDGLGSWGTPQGTTKFYNFCTNTRKLKIASPEDYAYKVQCNRYIHPGTDERGHFIRKIYCGISSTGEGCSYAVITYSWEGTPHPITVTVPSPLPPRQRPYGARSWEAADVDLSVDEGIMHRGQPLLSRVAVDFGSACKILLAGVEIAQHRICAQVPRDFRDGGTFVVDIESCGGERMLCKDGHEWSKPSGSSRYFRFNEDGTISRVDRTGVIPLDDEFDVQVLAKRYECSDVPSFVRKIYIARDKADDPRVNTHVAVLTYHWKSEPVIARANRDAVIARKRQAESGETAVVEGRADLDNIDLEPLRMKRPTSTNRFKVRAGQIVKPKALPMIDVLSRVRLSHTDHLRRLALTKKSENLCRLAAILDRAEPVLERFEQYFLTHCQDVRSFNSHETVWVEQHHLAGRRPMEKADQRGEECIIVDGGGEPIEVPPGCLQIVYESPSGSEAFS